MVGANQRVVGNHAKERTRRSSFNPTQKALIVESCNTFMENPYPDLKKEYSESDAEISRAVLLGKARCSK